MKVFTIRQASEAIGRAPATIRRYIKSGRLPAEKEQGKFGAEFRIRDEDLASLGVTPGEPRTEAIATRAATGEALPIRALVEEISQRFVPREIYSELVMKHDRLLVQYGMIRAGGSKTLELRAEVEMKDGLLAEREREIREMKERFEKEIGFLQNHLRQAEIEIEDRNIEITLLRDQVRKLEMTAASAPAIRSFEEEVRAMQDSGKASAEPPSLVTDPGDVRKIDALQEWLRACEGERGKAEI